MSDQRHTAGVTTRLIIVYIRRRLGDEGVERLLELAGEDRPTEVLEDESTWSTYDQKIALFEAAAELTGDPWVARRIGEAVLTEQLGALLRVVIGALGSPQRVLRSIARANVKFATSATMRTISTGAGGGTVAYRLHDEHEPSHHDCLYTQGLLTQVTVLFGLPPARIAHPHCQVRGAEECIYELTWPRWRWWLRRRRRSEPADVGLRHQLVDLNHTVTDLVSAERIDLVLAGIAARAGSAVHAQHHVLAVRVQGRERVLAEGIDAAEAQRLGHQLLRSGTVQPAGAEPIVAPVASAHREYGWLAAFEPEGAGFLPAERQHLETYAALAAAALDVTSSLEQARRSSATSAALLTLSRRLAGEQDVTGVTTRVAEAAPAVVDSDRSLMLLWDEAAQSMRTVTAVGFDELTADALAFEVPLDATPELARLFADATPRRYDRSSPDPFIVASLEAFGQQEAALAPVVVEGEVVGLVIAAWLDGAPRDGDETTGLEGLVGLADQAALALARLWLLEEVTHAATHDPLTGLASRQLFHDRVERALADNRRTGRGCAVAFVDLDAFKQVNDSYGHAAGDAVLVEVAHRIHASVRESDSVARLAGDEFAVLLRDLEDAAAARRIAESLIGTLRTSHDLAAGDSRVTASIGIALAPRHGTTPDELLNAADAAMYAAKGADGDAYRVATDVTPQR